MFSVIEDERRKQELLRRSTMKSLLSELLRSSEQIGHDQQKSDMGDENGFPKL